MGNGENGGLGHCMIAISWLIAVYYNVIISHVVFYLFASFASLGSSGLPWVTCGNPWNTEDCINPLYLSSENATLVNETKSSSVKVDIVTEVTMTTVSSAANLTSTGRTPAEEYYNHYVLEMSSGIEESAGVSWKLALCLLLSWIIVLICLIRGIQSLGKVVYFTAIFPYIMLTILLIRGLSLPGAWKGILFYLKPNFTKLLDSRVWSDAATQIFYSLSACTGGLIAMSSYNKFSNNCYRDAVLVATINCATSVYAGFVIFAVLGFMATEKGVEVQHVAAGGPGLAFVVYPEAISRMPVPQLWAIFFFFMMATLGFGSQFSIVEAILSAFTDEFPMYLRGKWESVTFRTLVIFGTFLMGLPMVTRGGIYLLTLVDYSVSGFPLLIVGFMECTALNWLYGYTRFSEDIRMMLGHPPNIFWKATWIVITPVVILITLGFNIIYYKPPSLDDYAFPHWAQTLGWFIGIFPISLIVIHFLYEFCKEGGYQLVKKLAQPSPDWGPALPEDRTGRYEPTDGYEVPQHLQATIQMLQLSPMHKTTSVDEGLRSLSHSQQNLSGSAQLVHSSSDPSLLKPAEHLYPKKNTKVYFSSTERTDIDV